MKYKIAVTEELVKEVEVDAESAMEAMEKVQTMYRDEKIVLNSDDFFCESFKCLL